MAGVALEKMSDYKALFKAAKAQRTATPAKLVRIPCTEQATLHFSLALQCRID